MEVKDIQSNCLDTLVVVDQICKRHNLRYYLVGGTMLGAVRHGGFIPWDDDVDIAMPRADYEKFLRIAPEELTKDRSLQTYSLGNYPIHFIKVIDNRTAVVEKSLKHQGLKTEIFIDVFPLDGVPNNRFLRRVHYSRIRLYLHIISGYYYWDEATKTKYDGPKKHTRLLARKLTRILPPSVMSKVHRRLENLLNRYKFEQSDLVCNYLGAWGTKEIMPRSYFGTGKPTSFEGYSFVGVQEPHLFLRNLYGDYMELPPIEERISHHDLEISDLNA